MDLGMTPTEKGQCSVTHEGGQLVPLANPKGTDQRLADGELQEGIRGVPFRGGKWVPSGHGHGHTVDNWLPKKGRHQPKKGVCGHTGERHYKEGGGRKRVAGVGEALCSGTIKETDELSALLAQAAYLKAGKGIWLDRRFRLLKPDNEMPERGRQTHLNNICTHLRLLVSFLWRWVCFSIYYSFGYQHIRMLQFCFLDCQSQSLRRNKIINTSSPSCAKQTIKIMFSENTQKGTNEHFQCLNQVPNDTSSILTPFPATTQPISS